MLSPKHWNVIKQIGCCRYFAAKAGGISKAAGPGQSILRPRDLVPAEKDPQKLHDFVCGCNPMKGAEPIRVKEDHEYPDWLWQLRTERAPPLHKMDPTTKQYWRRLATQINWKKRAVMKASGLK